MARLIKDSAEVQKLRVEKQTLEQELARNLYQVFDSKDALIHLQTLVGRGLDDMLAGHVQPIKEALEEEKFLEVLKKYGNSKSAPLNTARNLRSNVSQFNASDCSDIIRLLGAWTEKAETDALGIQKSYRSGVLAYDTESSADGWAGQRWEEGAAAVWASGNRDRGSAQGRIPIEPHLPRGPANSGGMEFKRAWRWSSVRKMDLLFGLLIGADISGTTADSTAISERWGSDILHPYYYLLPLATIVYNMHHTLLEVALVLSLNDVIEYRIGFYQSLLPETRIPKPRELSQIPDILNEADSDSRNKHFLLYYPEASEESAVAILFDSDEVKILGRQRLSLATKILALARALPKFPTMVKVIDLIRRTAPTIYARLPLDLKAVPGKH